MRVSATTIMCLAVISACQAFHRSGYRNRYWRRHHDHPHVSPEYGVNHMNLGVRPIPHGKHMDPVAEAEAEPEAEPHVYTGNSPLHGHGFGTHGLGHGGHGFDGHRHGFGFERNGHGYDNHGLRSGGHGYGLNGQGFGAGGRGLGFEGRGFGFNGNVHGFGPHGIRQGSHHRYDHGYERGYEHGGLRNRHNTGFFGTNHGVSQRNRMRGYGHY